MGISYHILKMCTILAMQKADKKYVECIENNKLLFLNVYKFKTKAVIASLKLTDLSGLLCSVLSFVYWDWVANG